MFPVQLSTEQQANMPCTSTSCAVVQRLCANGGASKRAVLPVLQAASECLCSILLNPQQFVLKLLFISVCVPASNHTAY